MLLPQKHCEVYCNPAIEKPRPLHVAMHASTVIVLLSGWKLVRIRPLALSLQENSVVRRYRVTESTCRLTCSNSYRPREREVR